MNCETCKYYPPSSCDGKPCSVCEPDDVHRSCYDSIYEDVGLITHEQYDELLRQIKQLKKNNRNWRRKCQALRQKLREARGE